MAGCSCGRMVGCYSGGMVGNGIVGCSLKTVPQG